MTPRVYVERSFVVTRTEFVFEWSKLDAETLRRFLSTGECTCQLGQNRPRYDDDDYGACNAFSCIDPSAPCFGEQTTDEDAGSPTPSPVGLTSGGATSENNCFLEFISDGDCDDVNNNAGCGEKNVYRVIYRRLSLLGVSVHMYTHIYSN